MDNEKKLEFEYCD